MLGTELIAHARSSQLSAALMHSVCENETPCYNLHDELAPQLVTRAPTCRLRILEIAFASRFSPTVT